MTASPRGGRGDHDAKILDQVIGLEEAAELIGVHRRRALQLVLDGRLPARRVGRDWVTTRNLAQRCADVERTPGRPRNEPQR